MARKILGYFADESDEAALVSTIETEGAVLLPKSHPTWPIPVIAPPLPRPTGLESWFYVIWHPKIFTKAEMEHQDNRWRVANQQEYLANLWPVLELTRSLPNERSVFWCNLACHASATSFRLYTNGMRTRITDLSPSQLEDFTERTKELERFYRRLYSWIRRNWVPVGRARYIGASAHRWLPELMSRLNPGNS